jgi:hypothetical protein
MVGSDPVKDEGLTAQCIRLFVSVKPAFSARIPGRLVSVALFSSITNLSPLSGVIRFMVNFIPSSLHPFGLPAVHADSQDVEERLFHQQVAYARAWLAGTGLRFHFVRTRQAMASAPANTSNQPPSLSTVWTG